MRVVTEVTLYTRVTPTTCLSTTRYQTGTSVSMYQYYFPNLRNSLAATYRRRFFELLFNIFI